MNRGPLDLQSNALPLSYTPNPIRLVKYALLIRFRILAASVQFLSNYTPEALAVFAEQMYGLRAFLERNPQLFTSPDQLRSVQ